MTLIGLTGVATAGKDTFADTLVERHGYHKYGWSDALCKLALVLNPELVVGKWLWMKRRRHLKSIVDEMGWTEAKRIPAVREYLQLLGTEGCRECIHNDVWIWALLPKIKQHIKRGEHVIVTNCRFENEANELMKLNGCIADVVRPGVGPVNDHVSDSGVVAKHAQYRVINDSTIESLIDQADYLHEALTCDLHVPDEDDSDAYIQRFTTLVDLSIQRGIALILQNASSDPDDTQGFVKRNRANASIRATTAGVEYVVDINGEEAGVVTYEDGIVTVESFLAR